MKLYLVRHGQTDWNKLGLIQGDSDIPLNNEGIKQAKIVKTKIKDKIDICFASPLKRAFQTAKIITDVNIIFDKRLIERNMGEFEGKDFSIYSAGNYWNYDLNSGDYGVEKIQDLFKRTQNFMEMLKENYSDKTVLVVSHGATIRALNFVIKGYNKNIDFLKFEVPNCKVLEFDIK